MRSLIFALPVLALAACEPTVPDSGAGVGFGDYQTYLAQREAELSGQSPGLQVQPKIASTPQSPVPVQDPGAGTAAVGAPMNAMDPAAMTNVAPVAGGEGEGALGAQALAALAATAPDGAPATEPAPVADMAAPVVTPAPAVAPVIAPVQGAAGPNLAAYALAATNAPGQSVYGRSGLHMVSSDKACAKYVSPDLAQMAFLENGGPQKDPGNLDPDGDGFACGWDPRPFQTARQ